MRALIFDLRPDALTDEGLVAALTMQAKAVSARSGVPVAVRSRGEHPIADPDTEARVYQQAVQAIRDALEPSTDPPEGIVVDVSAVRVRVTVSRCGAPATTTSFSIQTSLDS